MAADLPSGAETVEHGHSTEWTAQSWGFRRNFYKIEFSVAPILWKSTPDCPPTLPGCRWVLVAHPLMETQTDLFISTQPKRGKLFCWMVTILPPCLPSSSKRWQLLLKLIYKNYCFAAIQRSWTARPTNSSHIWRCPNCLCKRQFNELLSRTIGWK